MNRLFTLALMALTLEAIGGDTRLPSRGLKAMFSVSVSDECNAPIPDAIVEASFVLFGEKFKTIVSRTDSQGATVSCGMAIERVIFKVSKDGFYSSRIDVPLLRTPIETNQPSIDAGKWLPWNQPIRIELLRVNAANHTRLRHASFPIPAVGKMFGMDLVEGRVFELPTDSSSLVADFMLKLDDTPPCGGHRSGEHVRAYSLSLTSGSKDGKIRLQKQNAQSRYLFPTRLMQDGWTNSLCFVFSDVGGKVVNTFPDRGYRGYRNTVLVPGERECVVFSFERSDKKSGEISQYAAVAPRFDVSSSNILNMAWFTSPVSNGVFTVHATGF